MDADQLIIDRLREVIRDLEVRVKTQRAEHEADAVRRLIAALNKPIQNSIAHGNTVVQIGLLRAINEEFNDSIGTKKQCDGTVVEFVVRGDDGGTTQHTKGQGEDISTSIQRAYSETQNEGS